MLFHQWACIFSGRESKRRCLSQDKYSSLLKQRCQPACRALLPAHSRSPSALLQLLFPMTMAAAWQPLDTGSKRLGDEIARWEHGFQYKGDFAMFYDLTDNLHYTKGPRWFISYIPVKNELQCSLFFSILFTQVVSHPAGKYLFLWVKMPKSCKADFQARQCLKLSSSTTANPLTLQA